MLCYLMLFLAFDLAFHLPFFWHVISHSTWHSIRHFVWHILIFHLTFYQAFYLAFHPKYVLTCDLTHSIIPCVILSGILSEVSSGILSGVWSGILSDILSDILSGTLVDKYSTRFEHSLWHSVWKSIWLIWHSIWYKVRARRAPESWRARHAVAVQRLANTCCGRVGSFLRSFVPFFLRFREVLLKSTLTWQVGKKTDIDHGRKPSPGPPGPTKLLTFRLLRKLCKVDVLLTRHGVKRRGESTSHRSLTDFSVAAWAQKYGVATSFRFAGLIRDCRSAG